MYLNNPLKDLKAVSSGVRTVFWGRKAESLDTHLSLCILRHEPVHDILCPTMFCMCVNLVLQLALLSICYKLESPEYGPSPEEVSQLPQLIQEDPLQLWVTPSGSSTGEKGKMEG